jgi:transcriptional regulator with XRE-family HTH domain
VDPTVEAVTFGAYLRSLRKSKKMTLDDVGAIIGNNKGYFSHLENGRRGIPSPKVIRKLSEALGCTHIGMMIKAGHITEEEVLTFRQENGINDLKKGIDT